MQEHMHNINSCHCEPKVKQSNWLNHGLPRIFYKNTRNDVLILFLLFLTACQVPTSYSPKLGKEEVMDESLYEQGIVDEVSARGGKPKPWKNHKNMRKQFEDVGERIEKAGAEICVGEHLQKNGCYYYFKLSQNEEINSRADGKNIIIYNGMMRFVESDDELAIVMAHEFSHNLMGHSKAQNKNATIGKILGVALDAFVDSQGLSSGGQITQGGEEIGTATYSTDFEKEADYVGMYVLARAGYDLTKAANLWRRLSIDDPDGIYTSVSHPSNPERFLALQKTISEIRYKREHHLPLLPDFKPN